MNGAILGESGTVMQFVGDAVMAVFGAPIPQDDHADPGPRSRDRDARGAASGSTSGGGTQGMDAFGLGIGLSTGEAAAALLGSEERLEYTLVGDTVNLSQRLQQWAEHGEIVLSEGTWSRAARAPARRRAPWSRPWSRGGPRRWAAGSSAPPPPSVP